jgi:hypothetical protein
VREVAVYRTSDQLTADRLKFISRIRVSYKFSRAYEGEVEWVKEKNFPLSLVIVERNGFVFTIDESTSFKKGSGVSN